MMVDTIVKKFINSKFFTHILDNYDVLLISIGGSRLCKAEIDISDYDIMVIVRDDLDLDPIGGLVHTYDIKNLPGIHLHYNIFSINNLFLPSNFFRYGGLAKVALYSAESLIYVNDKYKNKVNIFLTNKKIKEYIATISAYGLNTYLSDEFINSLQKNKLITKCAFNKYLYGIYLAFCQFNKIAIDYNILKQLRSGDILTNYSKNTEVTKIFLDTFNYINQHPIDLDEYKFDAQKNVINILGD